MLLLQEFSLWSSAFHEDAFRVQWKECKMTDRFFFCYLVCSSLFYSQSVSLEQQDKTNRSQGELRMWRLGETRVHIRVFYFLRRELKGSHTSLSPSCSLWALCISRCLFIWASHFQLVLMWWMYLVLWKHLIFKLLTSSLLFFL